MENFVIWNSPIKVFSAEMETLNARSGTFWNMNKDNFLFMADQIVSLILSNIAQISY